MAREVVFFPPVPDAATLHDICCRTAWALAPWIAHIGTIRFWTDAALPEIKPGPAGFDPDIVRHFQAMRPLVRLAPVAGEAHRQILDTAAQSGAVVLVWSWPAGQIEQSRLDAASRAIRARGGEVWNVDPLSSMNEGSHLLWVGLRSFGDERAAIQDCRVRLEAFAARPKRQRAYIFGTGPSLEQAATLDVSDGDCIISNSIVANPDLLQKLQPVAVMACDPIFHGGCSQYAAAFRAHLRRALETSDMYFFTVMRDYHHYLMALPESLHGRIVALPFREDAPFNFDIRRDFYLHPAGNVLTLGLLPLAGTFYDRITVIGCDGRPVEQNGYFWSHHKQSQINDKMANIQLVHPAFFERSYDDHYEAHCRSVAEVIDAMEEAGKRIDSRTPSYIPALRERQQIAISHDLSDVLLVSINPDAKTLHGHWVSYDDRLAEISRKLGSAFVSLGNRELDAEVVATRPYYRLTFRFETWDVGKQPNRQIDRDRLAEFEATLTNEVERLIAQNPGGRLLLYMYTGSLPHAAAIYRVISCFPAVRACVNTFWTCVMDCEQDGYIGAWRPFLDATRRHPRFRIFAITPQLKATISARTNVSLPLLPHPSPATSDEASQAWLNTQALRRSPRRILFPGGATRDKGFQITAEASVLLADKHNELAVQVWARLREGSEEGAESAIARIVRAGIEIIDKPIDEGEFVSLIRSADIIVLPYEPKAWRYRNSGLGVDALCAGVPIVCFAHTWLGDIVSRYGAGLAIDDPRPQAVVEAVERVLEDYDRYRTDTLRAARAYHTANSWASVGDSVFATLLAPAGGEPAGADALAPIGTVAPAAAAIGTGTATGIATGIAIGVVAGTATVIAIAPAIAFPAAIIIAAAAAAALRTTIHQRLSRRAPRLAFVFRHSGRFVRRHKLLSMATGGLGGALLFAASIFPMLRPGAHAAVWPEGAALAGVGLVAAFALATGASVLTKLLAEYALERAKESDRTMRNKMAALVGTLQDRIDSLVSTIEAERTASSVRERNVDKRLAELEVEVGRLTAERDAVLRHMKR